MPLKVSLAQTKPVWDSPEINLGRAEALAKSAKLDGSDLIVFPEQSFTGWCAKIKSDSSSITDENGMIPSTLREIAADNSIAILGSYRKKCKNSRDARTDAGRDGVSPKPYNTSIFIDENGRIIGEYSKVHLFSPASEDRFFSAGSAPVIVEYKGIRFGLCICYDLRFPEIYRQYAISGAQCIINQAGWATERMNDWEILLKARAIENQLYVIGVNAAGTLPSGNYGGGSMGISPAGIVLASAGADEEIVSLDIDENSINEARKFIHSLSDRTESLYIGWRSEKY